MQTGLRDRTRLTPLRALLFVAALVALSGTLSLGGSASAQGAVLLNETSNLAASSEGSFVLSVPAGTDQVFLDAIACFGFREPDWQLLNGATVIGSGSCRDSFIDVPTGDLTLRWFSSAGAAGDYSFVVRAVPAPETFTLNLDEVVNGNVESPGAQDIFTFNVPAGVNQIFLDALDCHGFREPNFVLTGPGALPVSSGSCFDRFIDIAPGQHTITWTSEGQNFGTYQFILRTVPEPERHVLMLEAVSYTHLTLPTIYSV